MKRTTTALTAVAVAIAGGATAGPADAAKRTLKGKTQGGYSISMKRSGKSITAMKGMVPTSCVSPQGGTLAGGEIFRPPGSFRLGATKKTQALQDPAMHYDKVTKHYTVTLKRGRRGRITGRLHLNFSFQTLGSSSFGGYYLKTWICRGDDTFTAR
jgi:hypothetical protein